MIITESLSIDLTMYEGEELELNAIKVMNILEAHGYGEDGAEPSLKYINTWPTLLDYTRSEINNTRYAEGILYQDFISKYGEAELTLDDALKISRDSGIEEICADIKTDPNKAMIDRDGSDVLEEVKEEADKHIVFNLTENLLSYRMTKLNPLH